MLIEKEKEVKFTSSFGVVSISKSNIDDLLVKADKALYKAKDGGRNRVCTFIE